MKEGLVLEIEKNYVIVLSNSGEFLKLQKNTGAIIGEVYSAREYKRFKPSMFYAAAALLAFMITSFAGYTAYANQIVGVIDITGDKTVKLYFNRAGNVQRVEGIENTASYEKLSVEEAIKELTENENSELKFSDSTKINASATKLKASKIDISKINKNLQKALDNKKNKIDKSKEKDDKSNSKDKNSFNISPGLADANNNGNSSEGIAENVKNTSQGTYSRSQDSYSRTNNSIVNKYKKFFGQVSKSIKNLNKNQTDKKVK